MALCHLLSTPAFRNFLGQAVHALFAAFGCSAALTLPTAAAFHCLFSCTTAAIANVTVVIT
jgi:hypothetical protein